MKKVKKEKGITLIALVITIIVLLILAGVSIATLVGNNGILGQATKSKEETEKSQAEEYVKLLIGEYVIEKNTGGKEGTVRSILEFMQEKKTENKIQEVTDNISIDGTIIVEKDGYDVIIDVNTLEIVDVSKTGPRPNVSDKKVVLNNDGTGDNIETNTIDSDTIPTIYISFKAILENGTIDEVICDKGLVELKNGIYVTPVTKNDIYTFAIKGKITGETEERKRVYIVKVDQFENDIAIVNAPKLGDGMKAIVYDETVTAENGIIPANWREPKNESEWYNYGKSERKWANAVTEDGSMWVWIPRYEYKILSGEGTSTAGKIDVKFIPTTVNSKNGGITEGYKIHPAFEDGSLTGKNNNYMNGEWDSELSGIWVAKFEATRADSSASNMGTSSKIKIQPDVKSWVYITIGDCYTNSLNMYNKYNSHLMKNSEWGMVAYLTHSKYGRNMTEVTRNNNSNYITGGGDYKNSVLQSTTGNTTGIYDLSGGAAESTAAYMTNGTAALNNYGKSFVGANITADSNGYKTKSTKYVTVYPYQGTSEVASNNYNAYRSLKTLIYGYGDAILETSSGNNLSSGWNYDYSNFAYWVAPFFVRGGYVGLLDSCGVFTFDSHVGNLIGITGFRPVLVL